MRKGGDDPFMLKPFLHRLRRAIDIAHTRLRWAWRLDHLGRRVILGRSRECRTPGSVSIGDFTVVSADWWFTDLDPQIGSGPRIVIGAHCRFLFDFQINAAVGVEIGDGVLAATRVFITDSDHLIGDDLTMTTSVTGLRSSRVIIGSNCWLGQNAVVLKGVCLGERCVVAANSVVTKSYPADSVIGGVPARLIRKERE